VCGITGFFQERAGESRERGLEDLGRMCARLAHRGPDDQGTWLDEEGRVGLGHRRLAILDLSPLGHQPMASVCGRYQLVYNGEAYNYREIQQELAELGHAFRGSSDTEVLLAAFTEWGPEETLARVNGMFALALWDGQERALLLARDRFGKKPLYYGKVGSRWAFASELKALRSLSDFQNPLDRNAITLYTRYGYVPCPHTVYEDIYKLPPGHFLWLRGSFEPQPLAPWRSRDQDLEHALSAAVRRRMISDVPLGAFLSGGIDSSLVVALMQEASSQPVRTFSLGFHSDQYDEAAFAREVAQRLGTDHTEHYVTPQEAMEVIPMLPTMFDEPFADSSQIPTFLVSKLARQSVKVALSGDGGDELFGGYNRYLWGPKLWRLLRLIPGPLRRVVGTILARLPLSVLQPLLRGRLTYSADKLTKLSEFFFIDSPRDLYKALASPWRRPLDVVLHAREPRTVTDVADYSGDFVRWMMRLDQLTYLPDDILVKVDRASMAVSLEARSPLLDPEVAAVAARLEDRDLIRQGSSKYRLRELLYKRLPRELFERPKAGFAIPLGEWLRGDLRAWAEHLLSEVPRQGFFRQQPIRKRWDQHQRGERDWSASLWTILMFQAWLAAQTD
jgi:asparagine synthase (glutamine-hydrolysing)